MSLIHSTDPDFRVCQISFETLLAIQLEAEERSLATRWSSVHALRSQVKDGAVVLQALMREERGVLCGRTGASCCSRPQTARKLAELPRSILIRQGSNRWNGLIVTRMSGRLLSECSPLRQVGFRCSRSSDRFRGFLRLNLSDSMSSWSVQWNSGIRNLNRSLILEGSLN